ncbi:CoA pyrophosphatase [Virgibacillus sp. SK37]|uniref:NUDIX hydrolase n=1 Tax=Virgibacillus sp. SK37 TaxID=403957 RepID=UPI0004D19AAA|nr:CoA pyrophosphatase [Virgibacillus sp. SK37]AIF44818.1 NUDIX hydrolase [Virgibacillus sp. SK37]
MKIEKVIDKLQHRKPSILGYKDFFKSAVLLPLININGETHILFEVRSLKLRRQPGDICFPGGRIDTNDPTPRAAALRETTEELGIPEGEIADVLPLDYIVSDFGRIVYPFVGEITTNHSFELNKDEVEDIFTVPLDFFLTTTPEIHYVSMQITPDSDFPYASIIGGKDYDWQVHRMEEMFYYYEGRVIWGLTAKIIAHFIELLESE